MTDKQCIAIMAAIISSCDKVSLKTGVDDAMEIWRSIR